MRDLFRRVNQGGIEIDISTFSKANKHRSISPFQELYKQVLDLVKKKSKKKSSKQSEQEREEYEACPIDSTVITLTSKILWDLGYHQVKLVDIFNNTVGGSQNPLINFGYNHDYKFAGEMLEGLESNQVGIMDRGFAALDYLKQLQEEEKKFLIRINLNYKLEPLESGDWLIGTGKKQGIYRLIWFCDLETKVEYRFVTNLSNEFSNEEVGELYRQRWRIELFWKFLKMHLKLDQLISKSVNGIEIQLYSCLIVYLMLQLIEIPEIWGCSLLDKLRYLQACVSQEFSYVHWIDRILNNRPFRLHMVY
jgi:putative transposase